MTTTIDQEDLSSFEFILAEIVVICDRMTLMSNKENHSIVSHASYGHEHFIVVIIHPALRYEYTPESKVNAHVEMFSCQSHFLACSCLCSFNYLHLD